MPRYSLLYSGHMPGPVIATTRKEARKELTAALREELANARRRWKSAHLERWKEGGEIRANRCKESPLWTRIALLEV